MYGILNTKFGVTVMPNAILYTLKVESLMSEMFLEVCYAFDSKISEYYFLYIIR